MKKKYLKGKGKRLGELLIAPRHRLDSQYWLDFFLGGGGGADGHTHMISRAFGSKLSRPLWSREWKKCDYNTKPPQALVRQDE